CHGVGPQIDRRHALNLTVKLRAELILARGRIRTLGRTGLNPQSHIAIASGKVVAVGGREVMGLRGPRTRVVDLAGSAVQPGFNDAHAHVVSYGLTRFAADLSGARGRDGNMAPNGLLLEAAMRMGADVQPKPALERRIEGVLMAQDLLVSRGITSVGAAVNRGFADDLRAFEQLACEGRLKMRVNEFL